MNNLQEAPTSPKPTKKPRKRGPYFMLFHGLQACLKTPHARANLRSMLVSHAFVDLWRMIEDDKSFDQALFNALDEGERDFMKYCLSKCKITSREFDSAYNKELDQYVQRLKMLQSAKEIGNDNPSIVKEMKELLDLLYQKGVFSTSFYNQLRRTLNSSHD